MDHTYRLNWLYERGLMIVRFPGSDDWQCADCLTLKHVAEGATPEEAALKAWEKLQIQEDV